jgi:hypothetical protein
MPRTANSKSSEKKQNIPAHAPAPRHVPTPSPSTLHSPSMVDSMKQGFGFGIGSAIARNLFNSNNKDETPKKNEITNEAKLTNDKIYELYNKCLEKNDKNIDCSIILQNNK